MADIEKAIAKGACLVAHKMKGYADKQIKPIDDRVSFLEVANLGKTYDFKYFSGRGYRFNLPSAIKDHVQITGLDGGYLESSYNLLKLEPNTVIGRCEGIDGGTPYEVTVDEWGYLTINSDGKIVNPEYHDAHIDINPNIFSLLTNNQKVYLKLEYVSGEGSGISVGASPSLNIGAFSFPIKPRNGYTSSEPQLYYGETEFNSRLVFSGSAKNLKFAVWVTSEDYSEYPFIPYFEGEKRAFVTSIKSFGKDGTLIDEYVFPEAITSHPYWGYPECPLYWDGERWKRLNGDTYEIDYFSEDMPEALYLKVEGGGYLVAENVDKCCCYLDFYGQSQI